MLSMQGPIRPILFHLRLRELQSSKVPLKNLLLDKMLNKIFSFLSADAKLVQSELLLQPLV